jgi:hypothetical protein
MRYFKQESFLRLQVRIAYDTKNDDPYFKIPKVAKGLWCFGFHGGDSPPTYKGSPENSAAFFIPL